MELHGPGFLLRPWRMGDEDALVRHANSRAIWRNLLSGFPHPYRHEDAVWWVNEARALRAPQRHLCIEINGEACGGIGIKCLDDAVFSHTGELGYWLGEAHWGHGIMSSAVGLFVDHAFSAFMLERIEAGVFSWNPASARVLEKNHFTREATMSKRVYKDGQFLDLLFYARLRRPER